LANDSRVCLRKFPKLSIARESDAQLTHRRGGWRQKTAVLIGSLVFLAVVTYLDIATPPSVGFSYFYAVPPLVITWYLSRRAGFLIAGVTLLVWAYAEASDPRYGTEWITVYNTATRALALALGVWLLSEFQNLSRNLGELVSQRTRDLQHLATRLAAAEDSERKRLAEDLHDGLGQMLSLLKMNLNAAASETDCQRASDRIKDAVAVVDDLIRKSRTLMFDLHPAMLDHLGLVPTVRRFGEEFGNQVKAEITVNEEGSSQPLNGIVVRHLFRSIKELISNAARHGGARQIVVSVFWMPQSLRLVVDDDGRGFDSTRIFTPHESKGLGLPSIHERLLSLGGKMGIESTVGVGTRVVMEMPYSGN
jgi:signal transduction histidine kinase